MAATPVHPDAFKPVFKSKLVYHSHLTVLIHSFLEKFPVTQVGGFVTHFFHSDRWVERLCVCVEVQSLIDPVV